jgi:predicted esterase
MRTTALLAVLLLPAVGAAQVERYELGRRLKRFEAEWEKQTDPAARKRALAVLPKASTQFLSLNLTEAARTVDDAYWALKAAEPPAAGVRWLDALCVVPEKRVCDVSPTIPVTVRQLYAVKGGPPEMTSAMLVGPRGELVECPLSPLPSAVIGVPTAPPSRKFNLGVHEFQADGQVTLRLNQFVTTVAAHSVGVSVLSSEAFKRLSAVPPLDRRQLEGATAATRSQAATGLRAGDVSETDVPVAAWADQAAALAGTYFTPDRPGDHTLTVPTEKATTACRLFVPPGLTPDKPVPLVVALHGAGGSENMFFESYGAGHIVKECQKRGWLLLSPRSGLLGTPPVAAIIDKLRERYPIDPKRVFLVGHSMGAGQAIDLVQRQPGKFAAVANLGGGGRVRDKERFATLPVFVGVGTADFALKSSRSLVKALGDAGAKNVTAKEYPDLEHLVIVREALPDVFALFDTVKP